MPEHIPVTGPELDVVLADEWAAWFSELSADHLEIPRGGSIGHFSFGDRAPAFRDMVGEYFETDGAAADNAFEAHYLAIMSNHGANLAVTTLVRSIEKELGRKASPFDLDVKILPVERFFCSTGQGPTRH